MGALGNGRRGGRSPPLLIGALIACVLVLGFNYWVSSARNVELQTKLYELEGKVRQAAAERGAEEQRRNELEEKLRQQGDQIIRAENQHKSQQENAQASWGKEKISLQLNISNSGKTIQDMKNQLKSLFEDLGKVQKELQSCQSNQNTLNKKLTYDMTQCNTQILAQRDECLEKVAAVKLEALKKYEKKTTPVVTQTGLDSTQKDGVFKAGGSDKLGQADSGKSPVQVQKADQVSQQQPKPDTQKPKLPELETNDIVEKDPVPVKGEVKVLATAKPTAVEEKAGPLSVVGQKEAQNSHLAKGEAKREAKLRIMDAVPEEPLLDDIMIGEDQVDEYDPVGRVGEAEKPRLLSENKDKENADRAELEEEIADYNGDDENEPEFEADKQAELAEV